MQAMDPEAFNISVRKFLKTVGVGSQREIEHAIRQAMQNASLADAPLAAKMTLEIPAIGLKVPFDGDIRLK
jgi:hypothetical protein